MDGFLQKIWNGRNLRMIKIIKPSEKNSQRIFCLEVDLPKEKIVEYIEKIKTEIENRKGE